ncbi:formyltetrahydrofolate deformylase [Oceanidesulfovibrio indonesiensis]|uniref:Formyltetrahydrofolate deformylase n=1 Tax=Oceanidesulfovibrio indonesiensis TaxID=54767 RepID=A0A7M3MI71_9BACT|nr:formyltetrahydrofolate deformylase [Oceanidesulfovibrio indonesiensis]TVM19319.1 formyltetrahydrofolate deformylase [Oceanidesulfovibrio indonesiensis]
MDLKNIARLRVTCPDKPGIIAAVTSFLHHHGANITALDQHATEPYGGTLYLRLEFQTPNLDVSGPALERAFQDVVATPFDMAWDITYGRNTKRMAILVSRQEHCLMELLWRFARGELPCEVTMVVSNHPDQREAVENFGIPYHYVPVDGDKPAAEARMLEILDGQTDLVVLARYMQILSESFVGHFPNRIINIHHSFLPAFAGADPYRQAYERGVKLIGATAHYVTPELDAGPIIEQDVTRVSHRHSVEELRAIGRDLERQVLARAVACHLDDKIIVSGNKTWVF